AVPVLVDAAEGAFGPDPDAIAAALPARAVLIVHLYGHALNLDRIARDCRAADAALIEDGSHSHGAQRGRIRVGSMGTTGGFSAGVVKNLSAYGDAGFITTANEALAERVRVLRAQGQRRKNDHVFYGFNGRLDELQAAVLRVKLGYLDQRNERRRVIANFYNERFRALGIGVPIPDADELPVYHPYVIRTPDRERPRPPLDECGIRARVHYPGPL